MTPDFADQEAERIIKHLKIEGVKYAIPIIAEALRKAYQHGQEDESIAYQKVNLPGAFNDGFSAAREMAAKVCKCGSDHCGIPEDGLCYTCELALAIRALKPEATNGESQSEGENQ